MVGYSIWLLEVYLIDYSALTKLSHICLQNFNWKGIVYVINLHMSKFSVKRNDATGVVII